MLFQHFLLAVYWIGYCAIHSLLANEGVKYTISSYLQIQPNHYRIGYNIIAVVTLIPLLLFQFTINSRYLFNTSCIIQIISFFLAIPGIIIMVICIVKYFPLLSGIRNKQVRESMILETRGLHSIVRHPLYLGTFLFITGLFFYQPYISNAIAVIIIIIYTVWAIPLEENKLIARFGDQYIDYCKKVPMLIPFMHKSTA